MAAFGRDTESSEQVWSAKHGYPGDPHYRDFYRDIGFDLPLDYIGPHIHPEGHRMYTGFKYQAITHDKLHDKWVYDPDIARGKAGLHASHFRGNMQKQAERLRRASPGWIARPSSSAPTTPSCTATGGTRARSSSATSSASCTSIRTPSSRSPRATTWSGTPPTSGPRPAASSWGLKGYNEQWLNETNAWTYRHVHVAGERMVRAGRASTCTARSPPWSGPCKQAARELMLAQASDWTFIMSTGTTVPYATRRFNEHIIRFNRLAEELGKGAVDEPHLGGARGEGQHLSRRRLPAVRDLGWTGLIRTGGRRGSPVRGDPP